MTLITIIAFSVGALCGAISLVVIAVCLAGCRAEELENEKTDGWTDLDPSDYRRD